MSRRFQIVLLFVALCAQAASSNADELVYPTNDVNWGGLLNYFDQADAIPQPSKANKNGFFKWSNCFDDQFDSQPIGPDGASELPEECQPDTLYSWGPEKKLQMLLQDAGENSSWAPTFQREIFSHINPIATFGYGSIAIRFKLKKGTKFFLYTKDALSENDNSLCTKLGIDESDTIVVRTWGPGGSYNGRDGVDYVICSPLVLDSWSYDTKTHYDEIVASLNWNESQATGNNYDMWVPYTFLNGHAELFNTDLDGHDWSEQALVHDLTQMVSRAQKNEGKIIFNPVVPKDPEGHFATARPVYWNTKTE